LDPNDLTYSIDESGLLALTSSNVVSIDPLNSQVQFQLLDATLDPGLY
jgi:hypothetical protein